jgi:hypothetical protein
MKPKCWISVVRLALRFGLHNRGIVVRFPIGIRVFRKYSSPPVSVGDTFQDLPRMPETADSSEPYIYKSAE